MFDAIKNISISREDVEFSIQEPKNIEHCKQYDFERRVFKQCETNDIYDTHTLYSSKDIREKVQQTVLLNRGIKILSEGEFKSLGYSFDLYYWEDEDEVNLLYFSDSEIPPKNASPSLIKAFKLQAFLNKLFLERYVEIADGMTDNFINVYRPRISCIPKIGLAKFNLNLQADVKKLINLVEQYQIRNNLTRENKVKYLQIIFSMEFPDVIDRGYMTSFGNAAAALGYQIVHSKPGCNKYIIQYHKILNLISDEKLIYKEIDYEGMPYTICDISDDIAYSRDLFQSTNFLKINKVPEHYSKVAIMTINNNNITIGGAFVFIDKYNVAKGVKLVLEKNINPGVGSFYVKTAENLLKSEFNVSCISFITQTAENFYEKLGYTSCPTVYKEYKFKGKWQNYGFLFKDFNVENNIEN